MEQAFGRYIASPSLITGVYAKELNMNDSFIKARAAADAFALKAGRRPRIMVAKLDRMDTTGEQK
jgi:methylmalonyl-CoA mutase